MDMKQHIEVNPEIMSGAPAATVREHGGPVFRGTRVPVQSLFEHLEANLSPDELLEFTLQRVRRPHQLKLELQPKDAAPERSFRLPPVATTMPALTGFQKSGGGFVSARSRGINRTGWLTGQVPVRHARHARNGALQPLFFVR